MTPSQLSAIRERLDAATPGPWEAGTTICCPDMGWVDGPKGAVCPQFTATRVTHSLDANDAELIANAPTDLRALLDEVERLTAWQVAVADGLGYLNSAEGQGGYQVAEPETIIGAWREQEREVERLTNDLAMARQVSGDLCDSCGWAMKFPGEPRRCEMVKWRDEWEAFKACMTEQGASAFARGAKAMREAAARECWAVSDEMTDRNDMLSEQGAAQTCATRIRVLVIAEDNP